MPVAGTSSSDARQMPVRFLLCSNLKNKSTQNKSVQHKFIHTKSIQNNSGVTQWFSGGHNEHDSGVFVLLVFGSTAETVSSQLLWVLFGFSLERWRKQWRSWNPKASSRTRLQKRNPRNDEEAEQILRALLKHIVSNNGPKIHQTSNPTWKEKSYAKWDAECGGKGGRGGLGTLTAAGFEGGP